MTILNGSIRALIRQSVVCGSIPEPAVDVGSPFLYAAGVAQLAEHQPSKLRVAGPNPVSRSMNRVSPFVLSLSGARLASSPRGSVVEHFLGKEGVTGSTPVVGSTFPSFSERIGLTREDLNATRTEFDRSSRTRSTADGQGEV